MRQTGFAMIAAASLSLAILAGCSDEETEAEAPAPAEESQAQAPEEQQPEPPAETEEQTAEAPPEDANSAEDAAREIREAAEATGRALSEGAGQLAEQGRQAMEDAGPALDRMAEIAGKIGGSMGELAEKAQEDFQAGVELLQRRLEEETGGEVTASGSPETALAPEAELEADARAAAQASAADIGPAYVGVWAGSADACALIDQEAVEQFAVITPTTVRRSETICNFDEAELNGDSVTLDASCVAEGAMEDRQITLTMPGPNTLEIGRSGTDVSATLVRCHLAQ